jgi:PAS domain S-box-containing protein
MLALVATLALGVLLALALYVRIESRNEADARTLAAHSQQVLRQALALENAALAMESAHRAYLVSGAPAFQVERDAGQRRAATALRVLQDLTADNAAQRARLRRAGSQLAARAARMRKTTAPGVDLAASRAQFAASGPGSIEPLRATLHEFDRQERLLLSRRSSDAAGRARQMRWLLVLGPGLGIVLLAAAGYALAQQLRRSEALAAELRDAHEASRRALDLVDAVHDAVLIYDAADLRLVWANRGASEQLGVPRAELAGRSVLDFKRDFDADGLRRQLAPLLEGRQDVLAFEALHTRADGGTVPVEVSVRKAETPEGAVRLVTVARDVSARRQAEDERDLFFSLSLDMLCISSADGYFKRLSPAFTRTLGWTVEEMLARPFLDFIHPDDLARTQREVDKQMQLGLPVFDFENRFRHVDGGWRWLSWKSAPQPDGRMFATARDVTERKDAEARAARLNRELEARQAELQSANRELEAFSYSVSHDLRAPLRHIDGYARMLDEDAGDTLAPEPRRYLRTITDSARRMGLLIDDLLAFSRLGRKPLARQPVDMDALVDMVLIELPDRARAAAVLRREPMPPADGDPALLRQVWVNLLSNAIKYSAPRGEAAEVTIGGERTAEGTRYWVRDNGVGFDMRYAGKLFGVFQRLHGTDQFEGTGVGLAIVQRIVARHGGRVWANAEPDRGACFEFELPLLEPEGVRA